MPLRLFKFMAQAIVLELDDDGNPVGERPGDVLPFYGAAKLAEWAEGVAADPAYSRAADVPEA